MVDDQHQGQGRTSRQRQAKHTADLLALASLPISLWGWFYPHPATVVITLLIALPLLGVGLLIQTPGAYQIGQARHDTRASLGWAMIFPAITLAFRGSEDFFYLVDSGRFALYSGVTVLAFLITLVKFDPALPRQPLRFILAISFCTAYAGGSLMEVNSLADHSAPQVYPPWGPWSESQDVSVSAELYGSKKPGDTVCAQLQRGALGISWFGVTDCAGRP
jgi:hypothetical protein